MNCTDLDTNNLHRDSLYRQTEPQRIIFQPSGQIVWRHMTCCSGPMLHVDNIRPRSSFGDLLVTADVTGIRELQHQDWSSNWRHCVHPYERKLLSHVYILPPIGL